MAKFTMWMIADAFTRLVTRRKYIAVACVASFLFLLGYAALLNGPFLWKVIENSNYTLSAKILSIFGLMYGVFLNLDTFSQISTGIITFLAGINVSMLVMRFDLMRAYDVKAQGTTLAGVILGAFAAGCPACATGLLALMGVTGGLAILPFQGIELKIASIFLLALSIGFISHSLAKCRTCEL